MLKVPNDAVFWLDHDAGFDVDDSIAHLVAADFFGSKIVGVSTNLWRPDQKAQISHLIFAELGHPNLRIYPGEGIYSGEERTFPDRFPNWPFGPVYSKQGEPYFATYGSKLSAESSNLQTAVSALIESANKFSEKLIVVVLGPLTNVAAALKQSPQIVKKINRIVVMGGWYQPTKKNPKFRLGYNTYMDLGAAETVFNSGIPTLLVNTDVCKPAGMLVKSDTELPLLLGAKKQSRLAKAIFTDMKNWMEHSKTTMGDVVLADPLAAYVAKKPEAIGGAQYAHLQLHSKTQGKMGELDSDGPISIEWQGSEKEFSPRYNVYVIKRWKEPEIVRREILNVLVRLAYPHINTSRFEEVANSNQTLSEKQNLLDSLENIKTGN